MDTQAITRVGILPIPYPTALMAPRRQKQSENRQVGIDVTFSPTPQSFGGLQEPLTS